MPNPIPWGFSSISHDLFGHLRVCYVAGVQQQLGEGRARAGMNCNCDTGVAAYPVAVAAWEALLNEVFLSRFAGLSRDSALAQLPAEVLDRLTLLDRTALFPKLAFGRTFDKGKQPYQDLKALVRLRNSLVHFRMDDRPTAEKAIRDLSQRGILLSVPRGRASDYSWVAKVNCTEGIRWASNTVAAAARRLEELAHGSTLKLVTLRA